MADRQVRICAHPSCREIEAPATEVRDEVLLRKRFWWCRDCGERWTETQKLGDVDSMEIKINLKT